MASSGGASSGASSSGANVPVVDLTETDEDEPSPTIKRVRHTQPTAAPRLERLDLAGGVLDPSILERVTHIAQQNNCVGIDGRGLAAGVAAALAYGCPYADRTPMAPANKFAIEADRATPGTIEVRMPPVGTSGPGRPGVICMFAQWEMGPPGKYNRVKPAPRSDDAATRERWFAQCLEHIGELQPPHRPSTIAFPHEVCARTPSRMCARAET